MSNPDGVDHFFQVPTTGRLVSAIACALWSDAFTDAMPSPMREREGRRRRPVLADRRLRWALPAQPGRCLCAHTSPVTSFPSAYLSSPYLSSLKRETERLTGSETHPLCREWDGNTPDTQAPHAPKQSTLSKTCPCRAPKQCPCWSPPHTEKTRQRAPTECPLASHPPPPHAPHSLAPGGGRRGVGRMHQRDTCLWPRALSRETCHKSWSDGRTRRWGWPAGAEAKRQLRAT